MDVYKIEKGISIPSKQCSKREIYPIENMEVGDSFFVPFTINHLDFSSKHALKLKANNIRTKCRNYGNKTNKKFTVRTFLGGSFGKGIRCWRIK